MPVPRVLIADDHQPVLDRVAAMLDGEFAVVGTASDGAQLLAAEAALHPDVLVVDICMPGMSGLEAASRIRQAGSRVPVVCMTACPAADMLAAALDAGVDGYVEKARLARDLVPAIRAALGGQRFVSESVDSPDR